MGTLAEMRELLELVRNTGLPAVPVSSRPLEEADAVLAELKAGKLVGRAVLAPA